MHCLQMQIYALDKDDSNGFASTDDLARGAQINAHGPGGQAKQSVIPAPAQSPFAPPPCSRLHMETRADFAIGLIAAKPVKPCDGGVFGALNSLSKTE